MKTFIKNTLLGAVLLLSACTDMLDEQLLSTQQVGDFYKNKQEGELALAGVYSVLWTEYIYKDAYYVMLGDYPGKEVSNINTPNEYDLFAWTKSNARFLQLWNACYLGVSRANTLIERMAASSTPDADKNSIIGQGKFLRSLYYYNLVTSFGGVPLHLNATNDLSEVAKARNTEEEVYAQLEKDLLDAEQKLSPFDQAKHNAGYVTLGSAKSLLAKVYLQSRQWAKAAQKAKEVMDMKVYDLEKDYSNIWNPSTKNGKESIFSIQHNNGGDNNTHYGEHMVTVLCPPGITLPNGKGAQFAKEGSSALEINKAYFNALPNNYRKWASVRDRMPGYFPVGSTQMVKDTVVLPKVYVVKYYFPDLSTAYLQTGVNVTLLRYSDILLMYAEAINESGGPTADAYEAINKVRRRARAVGTQYEQPEPAYPDLKGLSQVEFRKAVMDERAIEFIGEGMRRNDLNRQNLLIQEAQSQGIGTVKAGFKLFPIPDYQIGLNPLLTQNPDY
jgi:starch-binding outer membrane protein, SusD/RagB family